MVGVLRQGGLAENVAYLESETLHHLAVVGAVVVVVEVDPVVVSARALARDIVVTANASAQCASPATAGGVRSLSTAYYLYVLVTEYRLT